MSDKLDEMWAALAEHQPAPTYVGAWQRMLRERTAEAAYKAACVAADVAAGSPPLSADAVRAAAAEAAAYAAVEVARSAEAEEDLRKVNAELLGALRNLLTAVTFADPPKEFNGVLCHEARVPVGFVDAARAAIAKAEGVK